MPAIIRGIRADIPPRLPEELFDVLASSEHAKVERIVSLGHASPEGFWYDQPQDEFVILLQGAARLRYEGEEAVDLGPGDFLTIPAGQRHRVDWTAPDGPTIWLAVHFPNPDRARQG